MIGADDPVKGMIPIAFVSPGGVHDDGPALVDRIVHAVRSELGAVAALKKVHIVPQLPKTRSGKILRKLLRKIVNREAYDLPPTIEDVSVPAAIAEIVNAESERNLQKPGSLRPVQ